MCSRHIGLCEYKFFGAYNFMNCIYGAMTNQRNIQYCKIADGTQNHRKAFISQTPLSLVARKSKKPRTAATGSANRIPRADMEKFPYKEI